MVDDITNAGEFLIKLDHDFKPSAPSAPTSFEPHRVAPREFGLTMVKLIDNQFGPCPIGAQFPMHGGTLVLNFSACVHTDQNVPNGSVAQVGYELFVDNVSVGRAVTLVWAQDVWGYCSTDLVVPNLSVDNHIVTIQPWGPFTSNDQFNIFNLTALEF